MPSALGLCWVLGDGAPELGRVRAGLQEGAAGTGQSSHMSKSRDFSLTVEQNKTSLELG